MAQDLRVINILAPGQANTLENVPYLDVGTIQKYYHYLDNTLEKGLQLTGRESMGYFEWEGCFEWADSEPREYKRLKKMKASYTDRYEFSSLILNISSENIIAKVVRVSDQKIFDIPLEDLEVCNKANSLMDILEDYSYWYVNFGG